MTIDECNPLLVAVREHLEADLAQRTRCQRGDHDMLATASPSMVICRVCRTLGVCLWCGLTLPPGACITVCATHIGAVRWQARHSPCTTIEARRPDDQRQEDQCHDR